MMASWKEEIIRQLKEEAKSLPPDTRFHPIRTMMLRFGTSQRTIEQIMEILIAENIMIRRPGSGYFTRNLAQKKRLHYRLLLPDWPSASLKNLESGFRAYADAGGEIDFSCRSIGRGGEFFQHFPVEDCDAFLIRPPSGTISRAGLAYLCSISVPVVVLSHEVGDCGISQVSDYPFAGGAGAAAHLINHGHRKLAMLITEPYNRGIDMRCQGFLNFAQLNGIDMQTIDADLENWDTYEGRVYQTLSAHLDRHGLDFTGLFLISAASALEVYKAFNDRGIRIPDDVSIVTHDDSPCHQFMQPPLDHIGWEWDGALFQRICTEIKKVIDGRQTCFHIRLPSEVTKRKSVRNLNE